MKQQAQRIRRKLRWQGHREHKRWSNGGTSHGQRKREDGGQVGDRNCAFPVTWRGRKCTGISWPGGMPRRRLAMFSTPSLKALPVKPLPLSVEITSGRLVVSESDLSKHAGSGVQGGGKDSSTDLPNCATKRWSSSAVARDAPSNELR